MKPEAALSHWPLRYALHHAEPRLFIWLPSHLSFIANIARKRLELKWDKTIASIAYRLGGREHSKFPLNVAFFVRREY